MRRRDILLGALPAASLLLAKPAWARPASQLWRFDTLGRVAGRQVQIIGAPTLVASPWGPATQFGGVGDGLLIDRHPLADARTFTFEALFRPDGGAFEQRWFHLETDAGSTALGTGTTRMLFEIRVVDDTWYLDAFATGPDYRQTLVVPTKRFPIGRWYHVAQTYDGEIYRSFVDGQLQAEAALRFVPQGPGHAAVGMRMNRVNFFHGAVRAAFFAHRAHTPDDFTLLPRD